MRPRLKEFNPQDEFNLEDTQFGAPDEFFNATEMAASNSFITEALRGIDAWGYADKAGRWLQGVDDPVMSDEQVQDALKDRPGLKLPKGVRQSTLSSMVRSYDDQAVYNFYANHASPDSLASTSMFAGSLAGGMVDAPALFVGGETGFLAKGLTKTFATSTAERMGINDLMGTGWAKLGTQIADNAVTTGAGFGGYQATQEVGRQFERQMNDQPTDWLESAARVGQSITTGATLGTIFGLTGMLASKAFDHMPENMKRFMSENYAMTTDKANLMARVDAMSQVMNGNVPDVSPILKQGELDHAAQLRDSLIEEGIDPDEFVNHLEQAKVNLRDEIAELFARRDLPQTLEDLVNRVTEGIRKNPDVKIDDNVIHEAIKNEFEVNDHQANRLFDVVRRFLPERAKEGEVISQKNMEKLIRQGKNPKTEVPKAVTDRIKMRDRIAKLKQQIAGKQRSLDRAETKKPLQRDIKKLQKQLKKLQDQFKEAPSVNEEIEQIDQQLRDKDGNLKQNFKNTNAYKRLHDLSRISDKARNKLMEYNLSTKRQLTGLYKQLVNKMIGDLYHQFLIADMTGRQADGRVAPVTQEDVKAYADHIANRPGEPIPDTLGGEQDVSMREVRDSLYDEDTTNAILDAIPLEEMKQDFNEIKEAQRQMPIYEKMTKEIAKCLLGGGGV